MPFLRAPPPTVVYLDADTIALRNLDALFLCDGLCGVMRHSERLNSGVMVLQPQAQLFSDMMSRIEQTPSYTGGDQGFLNAYFSGFAASPLFDPGRGRLLSESWARPPPGNATGGAAARVRMGRLPTEYNADLGLYVLNSNRWMVPEVGSQGIVGAGWVSPQQHRARDLNGGCVSKRRWVSESLPPCARLRLRLPYIPGAVVVQHLHPKPPGTLRAPLTPLLSFLPTPHQDELFVLHFTLSSFKPWNWWSSWIISGNMERWQALRRRLPGPDTGPSRLLVSTLAAGPWLLFALFMRRTPSLSPCLRNLSFRRGAPGMSGALALERVACMPWVILLAALTSLCLAVGFAVCLVPTQVGGGLWAWEWCCGRSLPNVCRGGVFRYAPPPRAVEEVVIHWLHQSRGGFHDPTLSPRSCIPPLPRTHRWTPCGVGCWPMSGLRCPSLRCLVPVSGQSTSGASGCARRATTFRQLKGRPWDQCM